MNPTLREQDLLEILSFNLSHYQIGDVIAFACEGKEEYTIHRIIKLGDARVRTKGDNNFLDDPTWIHSDQILGRVVARWRNRKRKKVWGGRIGLIWSHLVRNVKKLDGKLSPKLHHIYRFLSSRGFFSALLPERFRPQIQAFHSASDTQYKLTMGERMVGWYDAEFEVWRIQRPFRLFVDEKRLKRDA